jgi:hypothetical protein
MQVFIIGNSGPHANIDAVGPYAFLNGDIHCGTWVADIIVITE